jgi:type IV pilus assembly protein PilE
MVVVAIVAILAAIAYPSYLDQMRRSRRAEGKALLMEAQAKQERFFTENNSYAPDMTTLGYGDDDAPTENGWYEVSVTEDPATCVPTTPCTGFTLTADPKNDQANDAQCAKLSIDYLGQRADTGTGTPQDCW